MLLCALLWCCVKCYSVLCNAALSIVMLFCVMLCCSVLCSFVHCYALMCIVMLLCAMLCCYTALCIATVCCFVHYSFAIEYSLYVSYVTAAKIINHGKFLSSFPLQSTKHSKNYVFILNFVGHTVMVGRIEHFPLRLCGFVMMLENLELSEVDCSRSF